MTTHEHTPVTDPDAATAEPPAEPLAVPTGEAVPGEGAETAASDAPSWWHRSHPVFTRLSGFFTGLLLAVLAIIGYGTVLNALASDDDVAGLLPYGLIVFVVPLALMAFPKTRQFGVFLLIGMVSTAIVVAASGGITLLVLLN